MLWRAGASARVLGRDDSADSGMYQVWGEAKGPVWAGHTD